MGKSDAESSRDPRLSGFLLKYEDVKEKEERIQCTGKQRHFGSLYVRDSILYQQLHLKCITEQHIALFTI